MEIEFFDEKALIRRLSSEDEIIFIFGSALTAKKNGIGIPNVNEIKEIAINFIKKQGEDDMSDYLDFMKKKSNSDDNDYQKTFSFIISSYGIDCANEIIREVVSSNIDIDGNHKIPESISIFAEKILDKSIAVNNIITTNFDTLIEEEFKNKDIKYNGLSIVTDSKINENSNNGINIIHIHGVWDKNDTMHTKTQLNSCREKIESSIKNIISKNTIIIMGYGGWEDSFMRSLIGLVKDDSSKYTILWCFYEESESTIKENKSFFDSLKDASARGRVTFYKGIDCNVFFQKIKKKIA